MLRRTLTAAAGLALLIGTSFPAWSQPKEIRWGTGPVGSSGQRALVVLANLLNKEMPDYRITVLPTPGAVTTVKGFAMDQYDGYYGSDVALREFATNSGRFKGFKSEAKQEPIQSFWCYTLDVGLAIKASDRNTIKDWGDLAGKPVFTGPLPFDTRAHIDAALKALGIKYDYRQIALSTVGSQLNSGDINAMSIYFANGKTPPPWLAEASLAVNWAALNPSPKELAELKAKHFAVEEANAADISTKDIDAKKVTLLPFFWGFDVGLNMPADDVYKMLTIIDQHANDLAKVDSSFDAIANGKMAAFEKRALESTWNLAPIHPGLEKYLKAKGMWESKWDSNVAKKVAAK